MFSSIYETNLAATLSVQSALICMAVSIILGLVIAYTHMHTSKSNKNFAITLAVLPFVVQAIIIMVNGNLGTSIAVLGAFSLVKFRSLPGNSKEIISIFFAMTIGLAIGMGQVVFACVIAIVISLFMIILSKTKFGEKNYEEQLLKVFVPENLDYTNIFNNIFEEYTTKYSVDRVKTINLGSTYEISYKIIMKKEKSEKEFIDKIRTRNGNLSIKLNKELLTEREL